MKRTEISAVIFWGAIWGLTEATVGHLLHITALMPFGWLFWFPAAFFFMDRVYRRTGDRGAVLYAACLAAAVKLADLLAPIRIDYVINPAVSIVLEGLAVYAFYRVLATRGREGGERGLSTAVVLSLGWRVLYLPYVGFVVPYLVHLQVIPAGAIWSGSAPFLRFLFLESLANTLAIAACLKAEAAWRRRVETPASCQPHPVFAIAALLLAVFMTWRF